MQEQNDDIEVFFSADCPECGHMADCQECKTSMESPTGVVSIASYECVQGHIGLFPYHHDKATLERAQTAIDAYMAGDTDKLPRRV